MGQMEKAVTLVMLQLPAPARESPAWMHVPSQPLTRSPLSRFQTPADTSQCSRFFRVWRLRGSPRSTNRSAYFGPATICCLPFSAVDESHPNRGLRIVNAQG